jgi:hypothetical protein
MKRFLKEQFFVHKRLPGNHGKDRALYIYKNKKRPFNKHSFAHFSGEQKNMLHSLHKKGHYKELRVITRENTIQI